MKFISLVLAVLSSANVFATTPDAASGYVNDILVRGQQILELKDESDRNVQMCALLRENLGSGRISQTWLGDYYLLERDQQGVNEFTWMVPSILMSKATPLIGAGSNGSFAVDAESKVRPDGRIEVGVTVESNGRTHRGFAILEGLSAFDFLLVDVEYNGFSAVGYQTREYQNFLNRNYNKDPQNSLPVSALVKHISNQGDYVECP